MKKYLLSIGFCLCALSNAAPVHAGTGREHKDARQWQVTSPDGKVCISVQQADRLTYTVHYGDKVAIQPSRLGVILDSKELGNNVQCVSASQTKTLNEAYEVKTGKQRKRVNHCNEQTLTFQGEGNTSFTIALRAYNDGVAFRYGFTRQDSNKHRINRELTEFDVPTTGKVFGYPYGVNKDKRGRVKNNYEGWPMRDPTILPKGREQSWAFPLLLEYADLWMLITEAHLDGNYPATHLHNDGSGKNYTIAFPDPTENIYTTSAEPTSSLPWQTPWRVIAMAPTLSGIFATTLPTHLNPATPLKDLSWIKPGGAVWSWWAGRRPNNYEREIEFINYAKAMNWQYSLLDEGWSDLNDRLPELVKYAGSQGIGLWLWYRSDAGLEQNPASKGGVMCNPALRRAEMQRISRMGIRGIKVDFFDTDKQPAIKLYTDILKDAAEFHLMVDFHGCTVPRGWERTYPHLLTMEAVKGSEAMSRVQQCDAAPAHHTVIALTRNIVGSMDYTPLMLTSKNRKDPTIGIPSTTRTHQAALSVIFESGLLCYAEGPQTVLEEPQEVKEFLSKVPYAWDESHLLSGYPNSHVVIARRNGDKWFIAAINGEKKPKEITVTLPDECRGKSMLLLKDGASKNTYSHETIKNTDTTFTFKMQPFGGAILYR